jgi:putative transposase
MAPQANAQLERRIGSCRRECLERLLRVNQRHLEAIVRQYCCIGNQNVRTAAASCEHRPHEAIRSSTALVTFSGVCSWAA